MNPSVRVLFALVAALTWFSTGNAQPPVRAVVRVDRTNLRAKPAPDAEVLASLKKGDLVDVLGEEMPAGQKEVWSRVVMPSKVTVWIYGQGVDKAGHVKNEKLNFRAGPGRNYSVLGTLRRGDLVVAIREFDGWLQIAPPDGAVAYVASRLLTSPAAMAAETPAAPSVPTQRPPSAPPVAAPVAQTPTTPTSTAAAIEPPATTATSVPPAREPVQQPPPQPVPPAVVPPTAIATPAPAPVPQTAVAPAAAPIATETTTIAPTVAPPAQPAVERPPRPSLPLGSPRDRASQGLPAQPTYPVLTSDPDPDRVKLTEPPPEPRRVAREGVVHITGSVQAPTDYELRNGFYDEGRIDYLYFVPQKDLKKFLGKRVHIEGQEYLDSRWVTPVVKIDSIELAP